MSTPRSFYSSGNSHSVARVLNGRRPPKSYVYEQPKATHKKTGHGSFYGPGMRLEDVELDDDLSDGGTSVSEFNFTDSNRAHSTNLLGSNRYDRTTETPRRSGEEMNIISMLQQQQLLIQQVLGNQKAMDERQNNFDEKLTALKKEVENPAVSPISPTSSSDGKRKRLVTRSLSVSSVMGFYT